MKRRPYPSDVSDEEWALVAPYLSLLPQTAAQRRHELRDVFNAVRYIVRTGVPALVADQLSAVGSRGPTNAALDRGRLV